ncbi:MAG: SAM-dependent methyltransferase, partial [Firmicutes bacterium]|nr:SAM-dependent methyltransferase [Candidatus Colimorpha enterica]
MNEECLICKAPLEYLKEDLLMECEICHKKYHSKTRCVNGHFVCDGCHSEGVDAIFGVCLSSKSNDPVAIIEEMM